ncbi:SDR family NAD(P)-dependent oxidoreductase [Cryptosporangium aurantiacum]|uniref:NAD(P)-dependent dehydrogenase, short-chain alcohol dehydrogenase family n=1 Tax=Cryptosporangium aurantiacum TaxID=134849 RepID=A0A1M7QRI0_9ACTN|nr:SDR family NAD(P)-dependent oxidoreductase [Cryptosporangium aurantiacum]SHN33895.1 NAD(P)-dependent dehydrogenase, short-chain alcohol dehydrogenase family [Cryptosporangium aurantiacum]
MAKEADDARTVAITGANRGIGYAVAVELVRRGHRTVLVTRNAANGAAAVAALTRLAAGPPPVAVVGDLSTLSGVRAVADALRDACPRLDVLVHNAGLWPARRVLTTDGVEESFAVNHLAPFLLNHLLEPELVAARARVVQVSAGIYVKGRVDLERTPVGTDFSGFRTYADTKLCNVLTLPLFAERWADRGVTINAVHPGVIRTGLGARSGPLGLVLKVVKRRWAAPEEGARPIVRLVTEPVGNGGYYHLDQLTPLEGPAADRDLAQRVWAQAAALTGVTSDAAN